MDIEPNIEWYLSISRKREVEPRCPFATVESCPRYFSSLSCSGTWAIRAFQMKKISDFRRNGSIQN